ncbi:hypothetical protein BDU57DRAFT_558835 [Ampelomyces quisqualis]|uniref:Uncharacterized protein n=1 Tax=Ampelomyces quisqualis TaxID=50730 RepID=A0A6A5QGF2_AMPQU|nr:hypothetical protein BDU57DRAFT_558835 [Ampelomyces quisqualis]
MAPAWRIAQPYCVALAPAPKSFKVADPLWYAGCKTLSGEEKLYYTEATFETTYPDLTRWLRNLTNAPRSCFVTFGQNSSYFGCAPRQGSIWGGIPSELEDKLRKTPDTPLCVGLGKHNAWVLVYSNGYIAWKFNGHYGALNKILNEAAPQSVAYVAISPYRKEQYFVAFRDRSIKYNFKGAPKEWMSLMTQVFESWATEPLQKQPLPFAQPALDAQQRYYAQQQYPTGQAWQQPPQPQQSYQHVQAAAYNYNSPSLYPVQLAHNPMASAVPSPAPSYSSPVSQHVMPHTPSYSSPKSQHVTPRAPYSYGPPPVAAVEMPAELPGDTPATGPTPVPVPIVQPLSVGVSSSSIALLARDLWGADSNIEEEKVAV